MANSAQQKHARPSARQPHFHGLHGFLYYNISVLILLFALGHRPAGAQQSLGENFSPQNSKALKLYCSCIAVEVTSSLVIAKKELVLGQYVRYSRSICCSHAQVVIVVFRGVSLSTPNVFPPNRLEVGLLLKILPFPLKEGGCVTRNARTLVNKIA